MKQLLTNQNTNANHEKTSDSNLQEKQNLNEYTHKDEQQHSKETSSIDAEVIKGIQEQISSLAHWVELKKVRMTHPYPLEWDSVPYPPKFKLPMLHTYDSKSSSNQHIYYFRSQTGNVIDNDTVMARLFIGTLTGEAFDWFRSLPSLSINS